MESLGDNRNTFSIIDLSITKYIYQSNIDKSYSFLLDMEVIRKKATNYLPSLEPELKKCEYIIHEEISRFVSDNRYRRELNMSHSFI